jgi:hypothetical protein
MVEEIVSTVHEATSNLNEDIRIIQMESDNLKVGLEEIAAKNCSLRRKDFNSYMDKMLCRINNDKNELFEENKKVSESLRVYLEEQREWTLMLKDQVSKYIAGDIDRSELEAFVDKIKIPYQRGGRKVFRMLCDFQYRLQSYKKKMAEWNDVMRRLIRRGSSLGMEDMRQLEAIEDRAAREMNRNMRKQAVEDILTRFKQERQKRRRIFS